MGAEEAGSGASAVPEGGLPTTHLCTLSFALVTAASALPLSQKSLFAGLALNKDLETWVSKIQTFTSFVHLPP